MTEEYKKVYDGEYGSYLDYPQGENDKLLAGLSYILGWIVSLISLVAIKPLSPYLRFHAIQALGIQIIIMILSVMTSIGSMFIIGICLLPFLLGIAFYTLVIGIIVLTGGDHRVPWLGDYVEENFV
jgi:uncharacterized membrane protein